MPLTRDEELLIQRRDAALGTGQFDAAFLESQKLLQSLRARGDRGEERRALASFATLLDRAGDAARAQRIPEYLAQGFERGGGRRR
ncbi:MAG TPA: hypothetical protein VGU43_00595 [Thermoplasmata archaeon]|nr:hypothetical protein [Thermoplasmata archaeon]